MNLAPLINTAVIALEDHLPKAIRGIKNIRFSDGWFGNDILADVVIEEQHTDNLEVTQHPVERGANISDHAYKTPAVVTLYLGWSLSKADRVFMNQSGWLTAFSGTQAGGAISGVSAAIDTGLVVAKLASSLQSGGNPDLLNAWEKYNSLINLQRNVALFDIYTGKRTYFDMVCKTLSVETNSMKEYSLFARMVCQEVIIADTSTVTLFNLQNTTQPELSPVSNIGTQSVVPSK